MLKEKEKILRSIIKEELDKYKTARDKFYSNPIHWSNNKRKMNGMTVLRGKCNKTRIKNFPTYTISPALFDAMEACIDAAICENMFKMNQFVSDKELKINGL